MNKVNKVDEIKDTIVDTIVNSVDGRATGRDISNALAVATRHGLDPQRVAKFIRVQMKDVVVLRDKGFNEYAFTQQNANM